jgi:hypothetical protein
MTAVPFRIPGAKNVNAAAVVATAVKAIEVQ